MTKPEAGVNVLALTRSPANGSRHWCIAHWVTKYMLEYWGDDDDFGDYHKGHDMQYCSQGWYEVHQFGGTYELFLIDWEVIHWQELPAMPADAAIKAQRGSE